MIDVKRPSGWWPIVYEEFPDGVDKEATIEALMEDRGMTREEALAEWEKVVNAKKK